jgi:hypothetical protein
VVCKDNFTIFLQKNPTFSQGVGAKTQKINIVHKPRMEFYANLQCAQGLVKKTGLVRWAKNRQRIDPLTVGN